MYKLSVVMIHFMIRICLYFADKKNQNMSNLFDC